MWDLLVPGPATVESGVALELLDVVVLAGDLPEYGLKVGDTGTVIYVHSAETLCVEFMDESGGTIAVADVQPADVRKA